MSWANASAGVIFDEDFDHPPPDELPAEPEVIEPVFSAAELAEARADGWLDGHSTAKAEADLSSANLARQALATIATCLDTVRGDASTIAEEAAEAMARLLMDMFAAAFPALCVNHAEGELRAIVRSLLPRLQEEPKITIRVEPRVAHAISEEIDAMDPDLLARVRIIPTDAIPPGDLRVAWRGGGAKRDTKELWTEIRNALTPTGLLMREPIRETEHAE